MTLAKFGVKTGTHSSSNEAGNAFVIVIEKDRTLQVLVQEVE
jgi:hypothetical protein